LAVEFQARNARHAGNGMIGIPIVREADLAVLS
jgi:hypothetical protein